MKKILIFILFLLFVFFYNCNLYSQIEIAVEGISDSHNDGEQQDYLEAVMDAKLKAIEKTGIEIKAITEVENFQIRKDWIESKSSGILLPGFNIMKIGYGEDGAYHVVLVGKIKRKEEEKKKGCLILKQRQYYGYTLNDYGIEDIGPFIFIHDDWTKKRNGERYHKYESEKDFKKKTGESIHFNDIYYFILLDEGINEIQSYPRGYNYGYNFSKKFNIKSGEYTYVRGFEDSHSAPLNTVTGWIKDVGLLSDRGEAFNDKELISWVETLTEMKLDYLKERKNQLTFGIKFNITQDIKYESKNKNIIFCTYFRKGMNVSAYIEDMKEPDKDIYNSYYGEYVIHFNKTYKLKFRIRTYGNFPYNKWIDGDSDNQKLHNKEISFTTPQYNERLDYLLISAHIDNNLNINNCNIKPIYK